MDILAFIRNSRYLDIWHADRVLGRAEIGLMRLVGKLDAERQELSGLVWFKLEVNVVNLGIEIGKLDFMMEFRQNVIPVAVDVERKLVVEIDFIIAHRREVVYVEEEHFEQRRHDKDDCSAHQQSPYRSIVRTHERAPLRCYALPRFHEPNYTVRMPETTAANNIERNDQAAQRNATCMQKRPGISMIPGRHN